MGIYTPRYPEFYFYQNGLHCNLSVYWISRNDTILIILQLPE